MKRRFTELFAILKKIIIVITTGVCSILAASESDDFGSLTIKSSNLDRKIEVIDDKRNVDIVELKSERKNSEPLDTTAYRVFQGFKEFRWRPKWFQDGAGGVRVADAVISPDGSVLVFGEIYGENKGAQSSRLIVFSISTKQVLSIIDLPLKKLKNLQFIDGDSLQATFLPQEIMREKEPPMPEIIQLTNSSEKAIISESPSHLERPPADKNSKLNLPENIDYVIRISDDDLYFATVGGDGILRRGKLDDKLISSAGESAFFDKSKNMLLISGKKNDQILVVSLDDIKTTESIQGGKIKPQTKGSLRKIWGSDYIDGYIILDDFGNLYRIWKDKKRWRKELIFEAMR